MKTKKQAPAKPAPTQVKQALTPAKPAYLVRCKRPGETGLIREGSKAGDPMKSVSSDSFAIFGALPFHLETPDYEVYACASIEAARAKAQELKPKLAGDLREAAENKAKAQAKIAAIMSAPPAPSKEAPAPKRSALSEIADQGKK